MRAKGLAALKGALADAKVVGADTVLLVPGVVGRGTDVTFQQCWDRSSAEVKKATWTGLKERGVDIIPRLVAARCANDQQLK